MSQSAHPSNSGVPGSNPDYYGETSGTAPAELSGGTPPSHPQEQSHATAQPPHYQEHNFPPPPVGGPPSDQKHDYYPPPPPGPPPAHNHPLQSNPNEYASDAAPPGYTPTAGLNVSDEKPPVLPPRPSSSQGQAPYFAPPPGQSDMHGAGVSAGHHGAGVPTAAGVAGAADAVGSDGHVTDAKKKKTFGERFYDWSVKAGVPINKITNKLGSEAFWPTSLDKESDKAARILKSFCKDGFYTEDTTRPPPSPGHTTHPGPSSKSKTLVKIPAKAIQQAKGIAIFTVFRTGLHISGAGGSGIVVARLPDGTWSPPSGFLVHTLGAGFMVGLDIYDCVCVLNTEEAVRAFTRPRLSLGGEVAVVAGPVGAGAGLEAAAGAGKPVWSYMKSRGFYAGVQADGTVIVQRPDANAAFYGVKNITPERVLRGEVGSVAPGSIASDGKSGGEIVMWPTGARQLMEVLKSAEGKKADERVIDEVGGGPTPGDLAGTGGLHPETAKGKEADIQGGVRYG